LIESFLTGFFLGLSLILAIGAQNTFVIRQGILGQHVFYVALFCALADALLISIGVAGISFYFNHFIDQNLNILFNFSAAWLVGYGIIRLRSVFKSDKTIKIEVTKLKSLLSTISVAAVLTFLNPHVYLDTMILIGSISQQFSGLHKITFSLGASVASFIFFFSLAFGARLLSPVMQQPISWKILDSLVALILFVIAYKLTLVGNLL